MPQRTNEHRESPGRDTIAGFARIMARARIKEQLNRPLLGKPYVKYGQCLVIWTYFLQLGGILGAKHRSNLDAFGLAFLGARGAPGAIERYFTEAAKQILTGGLTESMRFGDYVCAEFIGRVGYKGDASNFFLNHGADKMNPETAEELAWQYSEAGAALGAVYPQIVRKMYEGTHAPVPKETWERARSYGLDIPPEQQPMSYNEAEDAENELFLLYCRECFPSLYSILVTE